MVKKLVLVYPNQRWKREDQSTNWTLDPRMLCLLGAMVKDLVDVVIIDAQFHNLSVEDFQSRIQCENPDYVGISVLTSGYAELLDIAADSVKSVNKDIIVIAGGVSVTTQYEKVIKNPNIDFACRGEGEYVLRELIKHCNGNGEFPTQGLIYRKDGSPIYQKQAFIDDLTKLPWPDYDLINFNEYVNAKEKDYGPTRLPQLPGTSFDIARGCPCRCSFCQTEFISGKKIRVRDIDDVIQELIYLKETYGIKSILFRDDNLFLAKKKAKRLLRKMIEHKIDLKWSVGGFAVFALDDEYLDLLEMSGCKIINLAIESGNERVLKELIQKPIENLESVPMWVKKLKERGMYVVSNFIIGYPGETWDEILNTIHFAEECNFDYVRFFTAVPLVGTRMYEDALQKGMIESPEDIEIDWRHSSIRSDEWTPKDLKILRTYEWDRINFSSKEKIKKTADILGISVEEMNRHRKETRDSLHV